MNNDNKPVRVLQVIGIMNRGGAEAMIMNLYREIDKNKVQFDFVENSFEPAVFDDEILSLGGKIYRCPHFNGKNYFEYKKWWKDFFDSHSSDYVAVHGHIGSTAAIYLGEAKKHGLFTIAHSHNTNRKVTIQDYLYAILSYKTRFIADYFFGCSSEAGESRFGKKIISQSNYRNFANAINVEDYKFDEETRLRIRSEFNVEDDSLLIGTIGRLTAQKNPKMIYQIFKNIVEYEGKAKCVWVGTGELLEEIKGWISKDNLQERIILTGVRSDIPKLLQGLDCMVFPSLYEGLPVTIIEAQASGLHCILSDTISKEVEITNLIDWHSLNEPAEIWAKKCIEFAKKAIISKRFSPIEDIREKGYDIKLSASNLTKFYLNCNK